MLLAEGMQQDMENAPQPEAPKEPKKIEPIDYKFLDGIRGIGAFGVYLNHFILRFYPWYKEAEMDDPKQKYFPPDWVRVTPFRLVYNGNLWVTVFFILSGFVLPLSFFKSMR